MGHEQMRSALEMMVYLIEQNAPELKGKAYEYAKQSLVADCPADVQQGPVAQVAGVAFTLSNGERLGLASRVAGQLVASLKDAEGVMCTCFDGSAAYSEVLKRLRLALSLTAEGPPCPAWIPALVDIVKEVELTLRARVSSSDHHLEVMKGLRCALDASVGVSK